MPGRPPPADLVHGLLERLWNPLADLDLNFSDDDQLD